MPIAKLTEDDLRETARENTQLTKLNALVDAANNVAGDGTPGPGTFTTLAASGTTTLSGNLTATTAAKAIALAGATGTLGFYGTAPIAKQTGVAVDAAGIHAALVALGLIAA